MKINVWCSWTTISLKKLKKKKKNYTYVLNITVYSHSIQKVVFDAVFWESSRAVRMITLPYVKIKTLKGLKPVYKVYHM